MATATMANRFVPHAILLAGERDGGKSGSQEVGQGTVEDVQGARAHPEANVAEAESVIKGVIGHAQVLAWSQQEVKTKDEAFGGSQRERPAVLVGQRNNLGKETDRQGFDTGGWVIQMGPGLI
jgi:hypothetical protein